jgi:hypothetical protein
LTLADGVELDDESARTAWFPHPRDAPPKGTAQFGILTIPAFAPQGNPIGFPAPLSQANPHMDGGRPAQHVFSCAIKFIANRFQRSEFLRQRDSRYFFHKK